MWSWEDRPLMRAGNGVKAWVVCADMGLGHQRAAYALQDIAEGGIITTGAREITSPQEHGLWLRIRQLYEFISRSRDIPLVGRPIFWLLDEVEQYPPFTLSATFPGPPWRSSSSTI